MINFDLDPSLFTHNPPLVLAVDDDPNTANMLETIFKRVGFQVAKVSNGNAALAQAQALLPDLILLDYMMPGMNGFEVLSALRAEDSTKRIPTIIVTAQARQPEDLERGLAKAFAGFDAHAAQIFHQLTQFTAQLPLAFLQAAQGLCQFLGRHS